MKDVLTKKQRRMLTLISDDDDWMTVGELARALNARLPGSARAAERFAPGWLHDTFTDPNQLEAFFLRRTEPSGLQFKLNRPGRILANEATKARRG